MTDACPTLHHKKPMAKKSHLLSLAFTMLLGPFGLMYASFLGGMLILFVSVPLLVGTMGGGIPFVWGWCMVLGMFAVESHNKKARAAQRA